jgi:hypothetical protein
MRAEVLIGILRGSEALRSELSQLLSARDGRALASKQIDLLFEPAATEEPDEPHQAASTPALLNVEAEQATLALRAGMLEHWKAELAAVEPDAAHQSPGGRHASPAVGQLAARVRMSREPSSSSVLQAYPFSAASPFGSATRPAQGLGDRC